jgi:lipoate-protein ligase A
MILSCRLLPDSIADGPANMAGDEVLLRSAASGQPSLRFYGWREATISLGYFQPAERRLDAPLLRDLPFVRRPTGGDALVHDHELTYCLAVPGERTRGFGSSWLLMHEVIAAALAEFGVDARLHVASGADSFSGFLCFEHFTAGDLIVHGAKVAGSAQRKQRDAVMQHGGILLAQGPFTPSLPGIRELTGIDLDVSRLRVAIVRQLERRACWHVEPGAWSEEEERSRTLLAAERYTADTWNRKR